MRIFFSLLFLLIIQGCSNHKDTSKANNSIESYSYDSDINTLNNEEKKKAFETLFNRAEKGDSKAANELGRFYQFGVLNSKDCEKAEHWYKKSSNWGYKIATHNLAYIYMANECTYQNITLTKKLLNANLDYPPSENLLGIIYLRGLDGKVDAEKGIMHLENAAKNNNLDAINSLGFIYLKGVNRQIDYSKAKAYFEKGQALGDSNALVNLSSMYLVGNGVEKNKEYAFELMEKAAKMNNAVAQFYLGDFYEKGEIVNQNIEKAKFWYRESAKNGYPQAQMKL